MSWNQSRTIGFTLNLPHFVLLVLGLSSSQTAEVGRTAEGVLTLAIWLPCGDVVEYDAADQTPTLLAKWDEQAILDAELAANSSQQTRQRPLAQPEHHRVGAR